MSVVVSKKSLFQEKKREDPARKIGSKEIVLEFLLHREYLFIE
jgi:hypothetical protein